MALAAAAQRVVRAEHQVAQPLAVRGGEVDGGGAASGRPRLQRLVVGAVGEPPGGGLVEHDEARVEAGCERPRAQDAGAEPVDRADPGGLRLARVLVVAERREAAAHPLAQLAGRLLGEGEREHAADRHAVATDRLHEALDHHRRLAGARVGREQTRSRAILDRGALVGREAHAGRRGRRLRARQLERGHAAPASTAPSPARQIAGYAQPP
jgi:hypothetical protein